MTSMVLCPRISENGASFVLVVEIIGGQADLLL